MKKLAILGALLGVGAALTTMTTAAVADPRPICLQSDRIDRTKVVDPQNIKFIMKDHRVFNSHLRTPCQGLRFNGFVYVTPVDEVCGGSQSIRVLRTDQVCMLGAFVPDQPGPARGDY
jgi:hypothetical protein